MELLIFYNVLNNELIKSMVEGDETRLMQQVIGFSEREGVTDKPLEEAVVTALLEDNNVLSELARAGKRIGKDLYKLARVDLERLLSCMEEFSYIVYQNSENPSKYTPAYCESIRNMTQLMTAEALLNGIIRHYQSLGSGVLSKYVAFRFDGALEGIEAVDTAMTFDALIGLEHQKQVLLENTRSFMEGHGANHVLLFGDRGTGKSSCMKALLNQFSGDGLRMIETQKQQIGLLPGLIKELAASPLKYIIYLDDLSFEQQDAAYKALKVVMEGQLQPLPKNVLIYATSNRKHLVKETWNDRAGDEVHVNDNMQETLSLAERFGISLVFGSPNQREYLEIVAALLSRHGIAMDEELEKKAIVWQMHYGSKSPRCAVQFVNSIRKG